MSVSVFDNFLGSGAGAGRVTGEVEKIETQDEVEN